MISAKVQHYRRLFQISRFKVQNLKFHHSASRVLISRQVSNEVGFSNCLLETKLSKSCFVPCILRFVDVRKYSTSPDESPSTESDKEKIDKKLTSGQKLKQIVAQYGSIAMGFHIAISLVSLGTIYLIISSGINIVSLIESMGFHSSAFAAGTSTFVLAYAVHKMLMPIRVAITVVSVPILVRYLRRVGLFKK